KLNPWDCKNYLLYGSCLDWVNRLSESGPYFDRAAALDPNGYYTMAYIGLHYIDAGNCAAAKPWLERSVRLEWHYNKNQIAFDYYGIATRMLLEGATNDIISRLASPARLPREGATNDVNGPLTSPAP